MQPPPSQLKIECRHALAENHRQATTGQDVTAEYIVHATNAVDDSPDYRYLRTTLIASIYSRTNTPSTTTPRLDLPKDNGASRLPMDELHDSLPAASMKPSM